MVALLPYTYRTTNRTYTGCSSMAEVQITMEELYQKEMREMQKEVNYLRHRVSQLNEEIEELKKHTNRSIQYLEDTVFDGQGHA